MDRIKLNVKYLRESKNWSKALVARKIGKTSQSIADYESGKAVPPAAVIQQYAEIFEVYVGDIVGQDMWRGQSSAPNGNRAPGEADRLRREKVLLHDRLDGVESALAKLRQELAQLQRELASDPQNEALSGRIQELQDILKG